MSRKPKTRFEVVARIINDYLKEDGYILNFKGYRETLTSYKRLADNHVQDVYDLMIDCLLWSNYMYEVKSIITFKKEEALHQKDYYLSLEDKRNPSAELENHIQKWGARARDFTVFEKHLLGQHKFFIKAHEQCKVVYKKDIQTIGFLL